MSKRADRLIGKKRAKLAEVDKMSTLVQEQLDEEQAQKDNLVSYVQRQNEPLEYEWQGVTYLVPAVTEQGHPMTYHDQYYQITRLKAGYPIEAKRMVDYRFDPDKAGMGEGMVNSDTIDLSVEPSEAYKSMKEAHEAQHPPED
ncbi:hypothetical protein ACRXCV_00095 (plasmid) [Halobacteriovorax sp. GFR7]|uniref:hypothetical protein n=1 Tax=unclassified Halobacteriovorax TaxID=2639665 RepID=UPI003D966508